MIRDFLYLDIDRVRSLVAQLREGVPDAFEETRLKSGKGGFKVGLSLDYALERGSSETRSVHHYLYSILEATLEETGRLLRVEQDFPKSDWSKDGLKDGSFVIAHGLLWLLDIDGVADALRRMPKIMELSSRFSKDTLKKRLQAGEIGRPEYEQQSHDLAITASKVKDAIPVAEMLQELYGKTIRIRVFPFQDDRGHYFSGTMLMDHLQRERSSLYAAGAIAPMSKWFVVGLVDHMEPPPMKDLLAGAQGQSIEDKILGLLALFSEFGKLTVPVAWPAVGLTPLAIYRSV